MNNRYLVLGVCTTFLLAGCSWFSWLPWVDEKPDEESKLEPAELVDFDSELKVRKIWSEKIGAGLGKKYLKLIPAIVADRVFAADGYGEVKAVDRFSGKLIWETSIGDPDVAKFSGVKFWDLRDPSFVTGGVGAGDGRILLGTSRGEVVALAATDGAELWRTSLGSEVLSEPIFGDEQYYVMTSDGNLVALDAETGELNWKFSNSTPVLTLRGSATPVYSAGVVYAGFANGKLSAVRTRNGEPIWEQRVMLPQGRSELERMVDVDGQPLLSGGLIYAASFQGRVKAMRLEDGAVLWEKETSCYLDLAEGYGQVYVVDATGVITAIDQETAEVVWKQEALWRRDLSSPVAYNNYVVVGDADGYLHVLAQSDGRFVGRKKIDGDGLRSSMVASDNVLYLLSNGGSLQALEMDRN